jgi:hypothetical protein
LTGEVPPVEWPNADGTSRCREWHSEAGTRELTPSADTTLGALEVTMATYTIHAEPGVYRITGIAFFTYANRYADAANRLLDVPSRVEGFDPVPIFLLCQSLELHLKGYLWLKTGISSMDLKMKYGHDLNKLWKDAKAEGLNAYAKVTPQRDTAIKFLALYYKDRKLNYFDLEMFVVGSQTLKGAKAELSTVKKLCRRLESALRNPILKAT